MAHLIGWFCPDFVILRHQTCAGGRQTCALSYPYICCLLIYANCIPCRNRMAKMEVQIANLTAWVQTALNRPGSSASDRMSDVSFNSSARTSVCPWLYSTDFDNCSARVNACCCHVCVYCLCLEAVVDYSEIAKTLGTVTSWLCSVLNINLQRERR